MSISLTRPSKVLLALVFSMTFVSWVLIVLAPQPQWMVRTKTALAAVPQCLAVCTAPERWKAVVIHESGQDGDTLAKLDSRHQADGGCPYHMLIYPNGTLQDTRRWSRQSPAPQSMDVGRGPAIHIALIGRFDKSAPTDRQKEALARLLADIAEWSHGAVQPVAHRDLDRTESCPGPSCTDSWLHQAAMPRAGG